MIARIGIGLLGGVAGLAVMEAARRLTAPLVREPPREPMDVFATERTMSPLGVHHEPDESAPAAIGRIAYESIEGRAPTPARKRSLSWGVHIAYGLLAAGVYGAIAANAERPIRRVLRNGALFGGALWLFGDELAVPLLGLADKPTKYDATQHVQALIEHLGYGLATATTTDLIRRAR